MTSNFAYIPNTVSDEWAEHLRLYPDPLPSPAPKRGYKRVARDTVTTRKRGYRESKRATQKAKPDSKKERDSGREGARNHPDYVKKRRRGDNIYTRRSIYANECRVHALNLPTAIACKRS